MQVFYSAIVLAGIAGFFVGLFFLLFKGGRRLRGLLIAIGSLVVMGVAAGFHADEKAKEAGFKSASDMQLAKDAEISDPAEFEERRAEIEAAAKAKVEAVAAERMKKEEEAKAAKAAGEARAAAEVAFYEPTPAQIAFVTAIAEARAASNAAANDLAKGGVRRDRAKALCLVQRDPVVKDWSGTIEELTTNTDGLGVVSVKIGESAYVHTFNNAFSDMSAKTMIDPDTALFRKLSTLKENDKIRFSGRFVTDSSAVDCHWESSLTLEGSLRSPEFVFRFSDVRTMP